MTPSLSIRSPFAEPVTVAWGGNTLEANYHVWMPFERWAYDLFAPPAVLESQNLEDYGIYGMDIIAPVSGEIVGVYENEKDHGTGLDEFDSTLGNYIFIRVKETGTYLVLGHLQYQSVEVEVGEQVTEGDIIARAGNTGMSSEPHLHIHHQLQNPNDVLLTAQGLPLYFRVGTDIFMPEGGGDIAADGTRQPVGDTLMPPVKDGSETSARITE